MNIKKALFCTIHLFAFLLGSNILSAENTFSGLFFGASMRQGKRNAMEDFTIINNSITPKTVLLGIFDGHSGNKAASIASLELPKQMKINIEIAKTHPIEDVTDDILLGSCLMYIDDLIVKETTSGTCALTALIDYKKQNEIILNIAWIGDSRAILIRNKTLAYATLDHKPNRADEARRINEAGAVITKKSSVYRVNGLAISRVMGDPEQKKKNPGAIINTPETSRQIMLPGDLLILASDGIWDVLTNNDILSIVNQIDGNLAKLNALRAHLALPEALSTEIADSFGSDDFAKALAQLIRDIAYLKNSSDNLSVIVCFTKKSK